jgi:hypothetical protein
MPRPQTTARESHGCEAQLRSPFLRPDQRPGDNSPHHRYHPSHGRDRDEQGHRDLVGTHRHQSHRYDRRHGRRGGHSRAGHTGHSTHEGKLRRAGSRAQYTAPGRALVLARG